jgi:hypothetical protein
MTLPSPLRFDAREVKRHADIFSVVSRYTRVRRAGRQFLGLCPLPDHRERHPSFYVHPDGKWFCFGCNRGGDVIRLVMLIHGCDFRGALGILARLSRRGNSSGVASCPPRSVKPESFAESAARIVASLPSPGSVPPCPRCSARMEFRPYRGNRFGGASECASCLVYFGPRELRKKLFAERGATCQWCRVSASMIQMHHVLKKADPFDPAFIVLLCPGCGGNVRKLLAIQRRVLKGRSPKGADRREAPPPHSQSKAARSFYLRNRDNCADETGLVHHTSNVASRASQRSGDAARRASYVAPCVSLPSGNGGNCADAN